MMISIKNILKLEFWFWPFSVGERSWAQTARVKINDQTWLPRLLEVDIIITIVVIVTIIITNILCIYVFLCDITFSPDDILQTYKTTVGKGPKLKLSTRFDNKYVKYVMIFKDYA